MGETYDYITVLEFDHTGAQAEGAVARSTRRTLGDDEAIQIDTIEIFPPYDATGAIENLIVTLWIDDQEYGLIHLDSRMAGPYHQTSRRLAIKLGVRDSVNPLENTCLKVKKSVQIVTYGGIGGVTGDYKIRLKGDYFKGDAALRSFFPSPTFNPTPVVISDPFRAKTLTVHRPTPITLRTWDTLSAGAPKAPKPRILPFITYARNAVATTPNRPLEFSYEMGHVKDTWEDLSWDIPPTEGMLIKYIGVIPHDNLLQCWFTIGGVEFPKERWDTRVYVNELPFGIPDAHFQGPRRIEYRLGPEEYGLFGTGEKMAFFIVDNGTSVPANGVLVGVWGKKIEIA